MYTEMSGNDEQSSNMHSSAMETCLRDDVVIIIITMLRLCGQLYRLVFVKLLFGASSRWQATLKEIYVFTQSLQSTVD
jgi:hypothetical protein